MALVSQGRHSPCPRPAAFLWGRGGRRKRIRRVFGILCHGGNFPDDAARESVCPFPPRRQDFVAGTNALLLS